MSIILFLVVLFVLVLVHEWGHFIVAKKTGMRVDEFGIGFPPKLWGYKPKHGETEYTLNALPIGGFVRILGDNGDPDEEIPPADQSRTFNARPKWAQALVLVAGVVMNVLFAWLLFAVTFMIGVPTAVEENTASPAAELYIAGVLPDGPADGVIPPGAKIISAGGAEETLDVLTPTAFSSFVGEVAPAPITLTFVSGGVEQSVELTPQTGLLAEEPERYLLGTSLSLVEIKRQSPVDAVVNSFFATGDGLVNITIGLWTLLSQAFIGQADFSQIAGPVGIVGLVGDAAAFGLTALLTFTAIISLNLAVINLLPFPALDGGRLVFVAIEAVTRKQIPGVWAVRVNLVGFALLMLLMIVVTYNDVLRLL